MSSCHTCHQSPCACSIQVKPQAPIVISVKPTQQTSPAQNPIIVGPGQGGAVGPQGTQGIQGTQGVQGTQGSKGIQGTQGVQGTQGTQGLQGEIGTQGIEGGGLYTFSETPPLNPTVGDRWINSLTGREYTYVYDNDSYQWVDTRPSGYIGAQGVQGLEGAQGVQGLQGAQGTTPEIAYVFTQAVASDTWTITHNLNFYPNVTIMDSAGTVVEGELEYLSVNSIELTFASAFSGTAYLS